ncbi:hypothetical protein BDU57DRAFT_519588 [Ampelomyces quisqualis]|uniref:FAD-binding PCMH-type domain-containing protein n=1 Tax=Ampelomyces quisqualis TaxID=50730 RepID=A0A6A5QI72_AMPQU|nr:hypothetical protein BDU57DRAFT_519588 [Ampelomyces quisqualis]
MRTAAFATLLAAGGLSQGFEPTDFNITAALLENGVDASVFPKLSSLEERSFSNGCRATCNSLRLIFGDDQVDTQQEPAYKAFINNLWSAQQQEIAPRCVFKPRDARAVSTSILLSRLTQCPFAAKSGGHSAVPGGSNIMGGVTINFEGMTKISVSRDKKTVSFQPGHTWYDIYTALEKYNVTVVGGRVASVGVGGLTLGGGISYFSSMYGLACDNVLSYELVTASGRILTVSEKSRADLYWALRGGGNNFGLVTQFTVAAFPREPTMWGGMRTYMATEFPALIKAYYNLGINAKQDGKAHQILSFGYGGPQLGQVAQVELEYADPMANASILGEYNAIQGALADQTAIRSLTELTALLDSSATGNGLRQSFWTWTVKLDESLATAAKDIFFEELPAIVDAEGILPAISLQVITEPILELMAQRGGNALGLSAQDGPLMSLLIACRWIQSADDGRINKFSDKVKNRVLAAAAAKGKASPYLYMNYASPWQDAVAGYGAANKAKLKSISKKYDPRGVFQKLQPGYFKLDGAPRGRLV